MEKRLAALLWARPRFEPCRMRHWNSRDCWRRSLLCNAFYTSVYLDTLVEERRGFFVSRPILDSSFPPVEHPSTPSTAEIFPHREVLCTIRAVLRRVGPLPLAKISSFLDDSTLESISTYKNGLAGFCSQYPHLLDVKVLPGRVHVLVSRDGYMQVSSRDQELVSWIMAVLAAAFYMPKAIPLSATPTFSQLFYYLRAHGAHLRHIENIASAEQLEARVRRYGNIFVQSRGCICLAMHASALLKKDNGGAARAMGLAGKPIPLVSKPLLATDSLLNSPMQQGPLGRSPLFSFSPRTAALARGAQLKLLLEANVPTTFFISLKYILSQPGAERCLGPDCTLDTVRELVSQHLPFDFLSIHSFGPALENAYVRRLQPSDREHLGLSSNTVVATGTAREGASAQLQFIQHPPEVATERYNIFSLGAKITRELGCIQEQNTLHVLRLAKGVDGVTLNTELLSKELSNEVANFFEVSSLSEPSNDQHLLIFDRLRHLYDVDMRRGTVRPWALLSPEDQPSSLTSATTPLPLVLHSLQHVLSHGPLGMEAAYARLPPLCQRQLLSLYNEAGWMHAPDEKLHAGETSSLACRALKSFVAQHSLFFVTCHDGLLCTPSYLATEAVSLFPASSMGGASNKPGYQAGVSSNALAVESPPCSLHRNRQRRLTEVEVANMVYNILPHNQPVAWNTFVMLPSVRATLPFDANKLRQDFFKRYTSYFALYESFASGRLLVGRADAAPPPPEALQPQLTSIEAIVKFMALHAIGGATEAGIMGSLTKEGRNFMKLVGTCTDLAEQLPQWFEVRRDTFHPSSAIITYIGTKPLSAEAEKNYYSAYLPLRVVRNDASLFCRTDDPPSGPAWNSDWDEDD